MPGTSSQLGRVVHRALLRVAGEEASEAGEGGVLEVRSRTVERPTKPGARRCVLGALPGLAGFGYFVRLETTGADKHPALGAVLEDADLLEVRVEASPGGDQ